ncbi:unnamed protein product [Bursaphelenchus okinawaensis]|uniref:Flavin-containing monooxygenase n=1 Tax=Bursaphelenchus okinawaensis TaxID=465554 RepID=A0A811JQR9_9BILA|nr:unnamed protein product [Bursaphelenchus okinawaensis]CAG9078253.1 unnamed protein product [Bursaphelenchus okinawaensis]
MSEKKQVCVIGAGVCGLPAAKWAVQYGLEPTVFEAQSQLGGLWNYKEEETEFSTVMKQTVINTSKEMSAYSDFVPDAEDANFMHHTKLWRYLDRYADTFDIKKYIKFNHRVTNVERASDYSTAGRWTVTYADNHNHEHKQTFDFVLVCVGHHATPNMPKPWPGQDKWNGRMIHSHSYKKPTGYDDKNVLVVGIGNSAVDVACELSRIAKQVTISTRRGAWVVGKHIEKGYPMDMFLNTRLNTLIKWLSLDYFNKLCEEKFTNFFNQDEYGLRPKHKLIAQHPTISDELHNKIGCGTVILKGDIKCFTENGVIFEDGSFTEVDEVVCCTGFTFDFPFLDSGKLIPVVDNRVELFKKVFPMNSADKNTLGVIGLFQPLGSVVAPGEMNCRLFYEQALGHIKLPSKEEMLKNIKLTNERIFKRYTNVPRHTIQVDYVEYMDEMATMVGCKPPMAKLFFTDYTLWKALFFGPDVPYAYRLVGPHPWPYAREAILDVETRRIKAIRKRETPNDVLKQCAELKKDRTSPVWYAGGVVLLAAAVVKMYKFAWIGPNAGPARLLITLPPLAKSWLASTSDWAWKAQSSSQNLFPNPSPKPPPFNSPDPKTDFDKTLGSSDPIITP